MWNRVGSKIGTDREGGLKNTTGRACSVKDPRHIHMKELETLPEISLIISYKIRIF
jgi:hypothetical protein